MTTKDGHELRKVGSSRVGPTYQGAGGRTVFYGYCECGYGIDNSANAASVRKKHQKHVDAEARRT